MELLSIACVTCNKDLQAAISETTNNPGIGKIAAPFIAITLLTIVLVMLAGRKSNLPLQSFRNRVWPLLATGIILGMGIGGFIDGILLHQILQWHEMLSHYLPPATLLYKSVNMFWDGIFHAAMLCIIIIGIAQLWRIMKREEVIKSGAVLTGAVLTGWGLFNMVEGIIDHQILKLHVVREASLNPELWNLGFLGFSVLLIIVGSLLIKRTVITRQ